MRATLFFILCTCSLLIACSSGRSCHKDIDKPGAEESVTTVLATLKNVKWIDTVIDSLQKVDMQNPPAIIFTYLYNGDTVYYINAPCCDQFSSVYSKEGFLICHPDGGFTGRGDGKCLDFLDNASNRTLYWVDPRSTKKQD